MNIIPNGDNHGGAVCDDPHVRICERRMNKFMRLLYYILLNLGGKTIEYNRSNRTILTDRLYLRMFETSDAKDVQTLCNNINIYKTTLNLPYPYSLDDALGWIKNHKKSFDEDRSYTWAITDQVSKTLYGAITLSKIGRASCRERV